MTVGDCVADHTDSLDPITAEFGCVLDVRFPPCSTAARVSAPVSRVISPQPKLR